LSGRARRQFTAMQLWLFRQPRYAQALLFAPVTASLALATLWIAPHLDDDLPGMGTPTRVAAIAVMALPFYCFWRTPPFDAVSARVQRNIIFAFTAVLGLALVLIAVFQAPRIMWFIVLMLIAPVPVAALRRELSLR
jgi:phosphatidylserine synthase